MLRKFLYAIACAVVFALGAYVWRIKNTGLTKFVDNAEDSVGRESLRESPVIVEVGTEKVLKEDVDWEYGIVTSGVHDKTSLTPIPDLGARYEDELSTLRMSLINSIIERKVLFQFVQQDREFSFDDPSRYTQCLSEWQASLREGVPAVKANGGRERLKSRLCERSILDQYLKERVFSRIDISEAEVLEYFKNHVNDFNRPEKVLIRHILLGDENEAKKVRNLVASGNFSELAKSHSIAPEGPTGGKLGPYSKGSLPAVFDVAFQMRPGDVSDVLKSDYGYHIVMLVERYAKSDPKLDDAKPQIIAAIRKSKEEVEYRKWVDLALAAVPVQTPKTTW